MVNLAPQPPTPGNENQIEGSAPTVPSGQFFKDVVFCRQMSATACEVDPSRNVLDLRPPPLTRMFLDFWNRNFRVEHSGYGGSGDPVPPLGIPYNDDGTIRKTQERVVPLLTTSEDVIVDSDPSDDADDLLQSQRDFNTRREMSGVHSQLIQVEGMTRNSDSDTPLPVDFHLGTSEGSEQDQEDLRRENEGR